MTGQHDGGTAMAKEAASSPALQSAVLRARRRLLPFLLLMYIIAFLDRANIAFARAALQTHAGISSHAYALGAGLFFVSYAALEIPSNLLLHRLGAKTWLARIMVTWGLVSMATVLVEGERSFYLARFLLGAAEAGFFPGVILYLTYWFPAQVRGRILGMFYFGAPLALVFGGPLSMALLHLPAAAGLQNWQWMFLVEGSLAVAVGLWAWWYLDNRPDDAAWLSHEERRALDEAICSEQQAAGSQRPSDVLPMLRNGSVWYYMLVYFLIQISIYGVVFYLPAEVDAAFPHSGAWLRGGAAAIPWICALAAVYWLPRYADRRHAHRPAAAVTLLIAGLAGFALPVTGPMLGMLALCLAASGFIAAQPLFWTFPSSRFAGRAAAAGLALINAFGNLGGFFAPNLRAWADSAFASRHAGLFLLASLSVFAALLTAGIRTSSSHPLKEADAA